MKEQKHIDNARSKKNGIIFCSNMHPEIGAEVFLDDEGNIQNRIIPVFLGEVIDYLEAFNGKEKSFNKWIVIIFDLILISICLLLKNFQLAFAAFYFSFVISGKLFTFIHISYQMKSSKGNKQSVAKFHAAEHMSINAYEKLQRIPTLDEVRCCSRFSKQCGSMKISFEVVTYTILSLILASSAFLSLTAYLSLVVCFFVFIVTANKKKWFRFLQVFVTSKPSDKELELAIEGLKKFEEMEAQIEKEEFISNNLLQM